jgi:deazaflavin-dependent oxidoreductase (nitroreductase family)
MTIKREFLDRVRASSKEHLRRYLATDGADGGVEGGTPMLILTTVGRRSGEWRSTPLIFGRDGDRCVVVASIGGADHHPQWYLNLEADPRVEVQVMADQFPARASTATGEERERLWRLMTEVYPTYDEFQSRTTREIPVVVLERAEV